MYRSGRGRLDTCSCHSSADGVMTARRFRKDDCEPNEKMTAWLKGMLRDNENEG